MEGLLHEVRKCSYFILAVGLLANSLPIPFHSDPNNGLSELLLDTDFASSEYWGNNFNDMLSGMNVMFNLIVVNNWTTCEGGYEAVTGGKVSGRF